LEQASLEQAKVGAAAPEFEVRAVTGAKKHKVQLNDYRGKKHVVLAFHVANWTPV
jgi:alkyl hydroperoxide reductase subunit AhpC